MSYVPYGRQVIDEDDIAAVADVLRGDWLTTGPMVDAFEAAFSSFVDADYGVAVSNGTAALHLAMLAANVGPGDEVIVAALTFAASANCARYVGADVVFADVDEKTLTIDTDHVASLITERTKAIVAVDYAGIPCDLDELLALASVHDLVLIEDACHAPGAQYKGRPVGSIAHMSTFSFHPVKHLTTGEGGMVTTNDPELANRVRKLRSHGISTDFRERVEQGTWAYDMVELGFNYRLPDLNCALGLSQLEKMTGWIDRRQQLVANYNLAFEKLDHVRTPSHPDDRVSTWHLYPFRFTGEDANTLRSEMFDRLRAEGIGVNVHYLPVYWHSYYQGLGYKRGLCPKAEAAYGGLLSLPMWPGLSDQSQNRVIETLISNCEDLFALR